MAYASVRYLKDGHKKNVPVTFIKDFDVESSEFDPRKTYLVFWSNDPDDTPQEALKRQQAIPVVKGDDADSEETAYYPATISTIKDSLEALLHSAKRIPVVSQKLVRDLSMDLESSSSSRKDTRKHQGASNKSQQSKAKSEPRTKVKIEPSTKAKPRTSSAASKKTKNLDNAQYILDTLHGSGDKNTTSGERNKRHRTDSNAADAKKRKLLEEDLKLSTESSEELDSRDPPFSPKKLMFLRQEVVILKADKKRLMSLNLNMQERLHQIEDNHSKCEEKLANAARFCSNCKCDLSAAKLVDSKKGLSSRKTEVPPPVVKTGPEDGILVNEQDEEIDPLDYCLPTLSTPPLAVASAAFPGNGQDEKSKKADEKENTEAAGNDGIVSDESSGESAFLSDALQDETVSTDADVQQTSKGKRDPAAIFREACDELERSPKRRKKTAASRNDNVPISTESKSPIQVSKKAECKAAAKQEIGNELIDDEDKSLPKIFGKEEPYTLSNGKVIPGKNMKILWDAVTGKGGDSMAVKNVCETFFGRNTLADSRVKGINKKMKKTEDEEESGFGELPSLDRKVLGDVKLMLKIKLAKGNESLRANPRLKDAVINRIITDKIKALRNAGYGVKVQPLLMAKRLKKSASKADSTE